MPLNPVFCRVGQCAGFASEIGFAMIESEQAPETDARPVRVLGIAIVALIVVQILANGYLPQDDSLRHAAKAVSGKDWDQILVHRPGVVDFSPGWHLLLSVIHRITGANAHTLVLIEVISLFVAFSLPPLLLLRRPE